MVDENVSPPDERDKDVINNEDWQKLEDSEKKKKSIFGKLLKREEQNQGTKSEDTPDMPKMELTAEQMMAEFYSLNNKFDKLLIDLERQSGKIEIIEEGKSTLAQRISELASQIGELRSVIVTREKTFDKMESEFQLIKTDVAQINPKKIEDSQLKIETRFIKIDSSIEKINMKLGQLSKNISAYEGHMEKIKSFDNLFELLTKIDGQVKTINEAKAYVDRKVAKSESIFAELAQKTKLIATHEDRLRNAEQMLTDSLKHLDKVSVQMKATAVKDDITNLKGDITILKKEMFKRDVADYLKSIKNAIIERKTTGSQDHTVAASSGPIQPEIPTKDAVVKDLMDKDTVTQDVVIKDQSIRDTAIQDVVIKRAEPIDEPRAGTIMQSENGADKSRPDTVSKVDVPIVESKDPDMATIEDAKRTHAVDDLTVAATLIRPVDGIQSPSDGGIITSSKQKTARLGKTGSEIDDAPKMIKAAAPPGYKVSVPADDIAMQPEDIPVPAPAEDDLISIGDPSLQSDGSIESLEHYLAGVGDEMQTSDEKTAENRYMPLMDYIEKCRKQGRTDEQIKHSLIKRGWDEDILQIFLLEK